MFVGSRVCNSGKNKGGEHLLGRGTFSGSCTEALMVNDEETHRQLHALTRRSTSRTLFTTLMGFSK